MCRSALLLCWFGLCLEPLLAGTPRAILADGPGPWQDGRWAFTASYFRGLLNEAGYAVTTMSPADPAFAHPAPDVLLAVPSLESLPFAAFTGIVAHVQAGGSLMASGGEPFRSALYLTSDGEWLDSAAYLRAAGSPPPQGAFVPPFIPTISPSSEQYTASAGVRIPLTRSRGLSSSFRAQGRYRVVGDLLAPDATIYTAANGSATIWLPRQEIAGPLRAQLVSTLHAAPRHLFLGSAGADRIVWLPGEVITCGASIVNGADSLARVTLQWSISGRSGVTVQSVAAGSTTGIPLTIGSLPKGDYTVTFRLMDGNQEVDRLDSPFRVLDPAASVQPNQKIQVVNGSFSAGGHHVFLQGVNYWPRNWATDYGEDWLEPGQYDPEIVEADLTEIAGLGFNLVNIQYGNVIADNSAEWTVEGRSLIDFLDRCRNHGIWVRISLPATVQDAAYDPSISPLPFWGPPIAFLGSWLQAAYLPGNDRVFAYEVLWEPMIGTHNADCLTCGRVILDPAWRSWVNDQYGSADNAQAAWGFMAPVDGSGQLTNPLDSQIENDGPWRIMVAAYRRFLEDYLGRNIGVIARELRRNDPDTLLTYRDWTTMSSVYNSETGYDIGVAAAHLDFFSPENYSTLLWPDDRAYGLVTAYSRYRTGGKPVQWTEFGADVGQNGGTPASLAAQAAICDTMMRQVADDGSNAATVWWWPGGFSTFNNGDFGIINPDGTTRPCAVTLSQWNAAFAAAAPDLKSDPPTTIMVDRDADARGAYGLFLNYQGSYVQARQSGFSVVLADQGAGTDTATMPLLQVGNPLYAGVGPLKFANGEFAGIRVVCPTLDVTVENGSSVALPSGATCQLTPTLVNTGEAQWLPASIASGGVTLQTSVGNAPLSAPLPSLQRTTLGPLSFTMGQGTMTVTGRLSIGSAGNFGEVLRLALTVDSTLKGACAISLSATGAIAAPSSGVNGSVNIATADGCAWTAASSQPWIAVTPATGSGNGSVGYTIQPNIGPVRQTTITVAGHPFTVTQESGANATLAPAPTLSVSSLSFGTEPVGMSTAAQNVTLTNTGTGLLILGTLTIGGTNHFDFSQTNNCGTALAPGQNCAFQVQFTPVDSGARTASLMIESNVPGSQPAVSLSGTGSPQTPVIGAVFDSWLYGSGIAPGLWVSLAGTNLGGLPQTWDLTGLQQLPVTLGGASVTFNGAAAAMLYVSANQINALVPAGVTPGPVQVVAQFDGLYSASFTVTAAATHPAVYALPEYDGTTFSVTAALAGTGTLIGNPLYDYRVQRAAYPGDTLDLYMIGLGATLDPAAFLTGVNFQGAFPVRAAVTASLNGEPCQVLFAGLTSPGLYLVRIVVPSDMPPGAQPLQVTAGGIPTRSSLVLHVALPPG